MQITQEEIMGFILTYGQRIVGALLIYILGRMIIRLVMTWVRRSFELRKTMDPTVQSFLLSMIRTVLLVVLILSAFQTLGVALTSFIAVLGAAGLAVGLAFQGSLSNFAGGVLILSFRPFEVGNFIETGGIMGTVAEIRILHTVLNTPDNRRVVMPNGNLANAVVTNFSANPVRRVDLVFSISYHDSIEIAKQVVGEVIRELELVLQDPEPSVGVIAHSDSSIDIAVRVWCNRQDFLTVTFEMNERVKKAFDANGISIPFPQRDVHLYSHSGSDSRK